MAETIIAAQKPDDLTRRDELLLRIYDQSWNSINTHLLVVWQSIGVVISALAIFALVERQILSLDVATALILLLSGWLVAHVYDAGYWYNRNLAIITNIERQFLRKSDLKDIYYYFGSHRPNQMIAHFVIQNLLGFGIMILVLIYHFLTRFLPQKALFDLSNTKFLPYIVFVIILLAIIGFWRNRIKDYQKFLKESEGIPVRD